jgi:hypothetical protein
VEVVAVMEFKAVVVVLGVIGTVQVTLLMVLLIKLL